MNLFSRFTVQDRFRRADEKDEPPLHFPETLDEFEYTFNERKAFRLSVLCTF